MQKHLILFIALFISCSSLAQVNLDSLWSVWNDTSQPDTNRLKAMRKIAWDGYVFTQPDSAFYYSQVQYDFAESVNNKKWMASALNTQAASFYLQGNYEEALIYYKKSLKIRKEIGDKKGIAASLNNIGIIYNRQGNYEEAFIYYKKCLKIENEIGDKKGIASSLNNIGIIYSEQGNYEEALIYYKKSLKIREELGDKKGIAASLGNIGNIYQEQGNYDEALIYHKKSLKIHNEIGDKYGIANSLYNIGNIYKKQGNLVEAVNYYKNALSFSKDINALNDVDDHSKALYEIYKQTGKSKQALELYELYIATRDTLAKQDAKEAATELKYQHRYETKAKVDSVDNLRIRQVKDKEIAKQQAELKAKQNQQIMLFGGLGLVILFSLFMINRFRVTNRQKQIIELQKGEVEEKNKEILDSIQYAKRLQEAILPPKKLVKEWLPQSFILYKPKDIVAGDFYWMESVNGWIYFAAADCTGHGVPGAMVSVICSNALSVSVLDEGKTKPSEILNRTRELVIERFGRSEQEINDGMDISLCALNYKTGTMQWAGANNPLWIIRSGTKEVEEIRADRQPIGSHLRENPFNNHELQLNSGDSVYLFSDGYTDQFGGDKGKKYKADNFKRFLLSIQDKDMDTQRTLLSEEFDSWKAGFEQVDDVCVMGVRV